MWGVSLTHPVLAFFLIIWGVSLTHPMLASFSCGEFLLHILSWLYFYAGSFSGSIFFFFSFFLFKSGEFLLHILCWLCFPVGSFSYTSHACLIFLWGVSLTHTIFFFFLFLNLGSFLHILCWLHFYAGSFSYTSRTGFIFYLGSFSYTSHAGFTPPPPPPLLWGVSLTHPILALFLSWEFLLLILCWFHFYAEFLIHIPCCLQFYASLQFYARSFSYTCRAGFFFFFFFFFFFICGVSLMLVLLSIGGASLTHLLLASFLSGEFLLHIRCWFNFYLGSVSYTSCALHFYLGSFFYTSRAGFIFIQGVSLTHLALL